MAVDALVHLPEQKDRIELLGLRLAERPPHAPRTEPIDHAAQIGSRVGEAVLADVRAVAGAALDDARVLEVPKACGEERARDAGQAALDVVEVTAPREQLAHDERRPSVGEDL